VVFVVASITSTAPITYLRIAATYALLWWTEQRNG